MQEHLEVLISEIEVWLSKGYAVINTMIITNDSFAVARIATIAYRTHSEFVAGAKAMMIQNLKRQMRSGIAHFVYLKTNGTGCSRENTMLQQHISTLRKPHGGRFGGRI